MDTNSTINYLTEIKLSLLDYLIIAVIFSILLLINITEINSLEKKKKELEIIELKANSTLALYGIIISFIVGIVTQIFPLIDIFLPIVPISLIVIWGRRQKKHSKYSSIINLKSRIDDEVRDEILKFGGDKNEGFTFEEVYSHIRDNKLCLGDWDRLFDYGPKPIRKFKTIFKEYAEPITISKSRVHTILDDLKEEKLIAENLIEGNKYLLLTNNCIG